MSEITMQVMDIPTPGGLAGGGYAEYAVAESPPMLSRTGQCGSDQRRGHPRNHLYRLDEPVRPGPAGLIVDPEQLDS